MMNRLRQLLKPKATHIAYAHKLALYKDAPWIALFFAVIFFLDTYVFFLPSDSLLAIICVIVPEKTRQWFFASWFGAIAAFVLLYFLMLSSMQPYILHLMDESRFHAQFTHLLTEAKHYGYPAIILAVTTVIPYVFCLIAGILVKLNPFLVLIIITIAKAIRIGIFILVMRTVRSAIVTIQDKVHDYREKHHHEDSK